MRKLAVFGLPGAGKGTQAGLISEWIGVPHISTGDLFRVNLNGDTELGKEARKYIDAGELVPDEVTNNMVKARLGEPDAANGFILDGFPRSVEQADFLTNMLDKDFSTQLDGVFYFEIPQELAIQRMLSRGRDDDSIEVIDNRIKVYEQQTHPLLEYYKDILITVDASDSVDRVFSAIKSRLGADNL